MSLIVGLLFHLAFGFHEVLKALKKLYFKALFIDVRNVACLVEQVFLTKDNIW